MIAVLLSAMMLVSACQSAPQETEEEKKIKEEQNVEKEEKEYQGKLQFRKEEAVRKQQSYFPDRHGYGLLAKQIHLPCTEYRFSEYRRV